MPATSLGWLYQPVFQPQCGTGGQNCQPKHTKLYIPVLLFAKIHIHCNSAKTQYLVSSFLQQYLF